MTKAELVERDGQWRNKWERTIETYSSLMHDIEKERDSARELAAMYLQCLNSRAMERGETVEQVADFCRNEFSENPWLEAEYKRLADEEAKVKSFCQEARLVRG